MRGTRDQGTWYFKTVDLSAYAGQEVYIAIRHFNVSDEYFLDLDDVTLSAGRSRDVVANGVENMHLVPGTYYIVASSTDDNFTVDINVEPVPMTTLQLTSTLNRSRSRKWHTNLILPTDRAVFPHLLR